jgi:hypothetical protein
VEIEIDGDDLRVALQDSSAEAVDEELARILKEWRADPARLEVRVAAFAFVAGGLTAAAAVFATREARDEPTADEILEALRDVELAVEEILST